MPTITAHVFIAVSLDGYIARNDGDIDWLLQRDDPEEDHGYLEFIADKGAIVMGRGCYEKASTLDPWPYDRPVVVLSRQLVDAPVPEALEGKVRFSSRHPGKRCRSWLGRACAGCTSMEARWSSRFCATG